MRRSTGTSDAGLLYLNCKLAEVAARGRLCVSRISVPSQIAGGGEGGRGHIQFAIIS